MGTGEREIGPLVVKGGRLPGIGAMAFGAVERKLLCDVVGVYDLVKFLLVAVDTGAG